MYARRPHPRSQGYDVVEFETKVRHEIMIRKDLELKDVMKIVALYVRLYERAYPETAVETFTSWLNSMIKKLDVALEEVEDVAHLLGHSYSS